MAEAATDLVGAYLRVRLLGADQHDVTAVSNRLGLCDIAQGEGALGVSDPDIVVRYEAAVTKPQCSTLKVSCYPAPKVTVTEEEVHSGAVGSTVALPLSEPLRFVRYRRGRGCPEVLVVLSTLAALANGALPLHGTAFARDGRGVVVTGRSGTGKTAVLLGSLARGAGLVAAEHVLIGGDGTMHGRVEAVRLRPRHRHQVPPRWAASRRLTLWQTPLTTADKLCRANFPSRRLSARVMQAARERAFVDVPATVFASAESATLDTLAVLVPADCPRPQVRNMSPDEAAIRLASLFAEEIDPLQQLAHKVAIASGRMVQWGLAAAQERYRRHAAALLAGRRCVVVLTPVGDLSAGSASDLVEQLLPVLRG